MRPGSDRHRRIVLGVTTSMSLRLMRGFPEHLAESGWDVHVVTSGPLPESAAGITYHHVTMLREPHPWHDLRALIVWCRLLRHLRPDVVSTGTPKAGMLGMTAAWLTRCPRRIYKLRGLRMETAVGAKRHVLAAVERLTMACANTIISVSPSLRRRVLELGLAPGHKVVVLGAGSSNGVDLDSFDPTGASREAARHSLDADLSDLLVGFIGRLTVDKGLPELLDAAIDLKKRGREFTLLLVGPGEDESCDRAVDRAMAEGVLIERSPFVEDPTDVFHAIDILCLPTRREGFPNVVLEAGASAIPTVTTDATGAIDSVIHEHTGLIARAGDAKSIADALDRLFTDRELRRFYGANARARVEQSYRRSDVWLKEAEVYKASTASHAGPGQT